ncbi:putative helicase [Richelia sinica FACHB-800]|uniref:Helicase n=1 Tax=Richelia sinica FACHB-800 TaxID=1357546 RepID=A0A975TBX6_9NOST|nr:DEAD/DEAH box helicase [Richelia sinica]MBD2665159.1 DEAD/DEAH box helicase [Richelia sinica FACHB-800]QXE25882.1 putative helicase [Richelia sinica FACHB-800]
MNLDPNDLKILADEVLTFIEQREAEQVAYGIYDVTMTGVEVIDNFQPSEDIRLTPANKTEAIRNALAQLAKDLQIIRFNQEKSPDGWIFRSRIAETVRLLSKLRQRIVRENNLKPAHRISNSKRLVADIKFSVASRRVPRRNIAVQTCMKPLHTGNTEQQQAANLLLEVIDTYLPKLRQMSGFQKRTLERILEAIELKAQEGIEKGVVVTASTGAGKTYAFFLPVLAKMLLERCLRGREGVKAICIYPRVALSENQLTDFIEVLFYLNQVLAKNNLPELTIGVESGAAVYQIRDFQDITSDRQQKLSKQRGWTYNDEYTGYLSPFAYCVGTDGQACKKDKQRLLVRPTDAKTLVCPICDKRYPFIKFSRDIMAEHPPDLLIATTESLHRRLLSTKYQYLFGNDKFCAPSVVMLDEIHLQTSTAGTQVALLLRRLMARIRLGKQHRQEQSNLAFVGLSATISEPINFLSELSGIPTPRIRRVNPEENEMQTIGAERYIFVRAEDNEDTAVISTLIQTAMCVLHTMPQPSADSDLKRYRTFGFVQSLDIAGRWLYQMEDAEKVKPEQCRVRERYKSEKTPLDQRQISYVPLYAYRYPPFNQQLFPNFFGGNFTYNCDCHNSSSPDLTCPYFQAGECWWVLSQKDKARQESLNIKRKTGSDRSITIEPNDDLIITTTALEVGYDDEALMCVLQYTAPANVASFVQRKGRGGRKVGTRPIVVTVLSPYKSTDLFLFRNEHILTDPTFQKLPLNSQNRYLQRIHGFYAFFDWLAYRASCAGIDLELDNLSRQGYEYLMEQSIDFKVLLEFKDYLKQTFAIPDDAITQVLDDESEGFLCQIFYEGLMKGVNSQFEREDTHRVRARNLLYKHLPDNLFSDINLPEVQVDYRPDNNHPNKKPNSESISLAVSETIPGNVTFRGGEGSTWIPPEIFDGEPSRIPLNQYYKFHRIDERPNTVNLPTRALKKVDIIKKSTNFLNLYRPTAIKPRQFSRDHNSSYWWCNPETKELSENRTSENAAQDTQQLAHSCSANAISAVAIRPVRGDTPTPAYTLKPDHPSLTCDPLGQELIQRIVFHSDETANLNLLDVRRIILGSEYTIKFHNSQTEEIRGVVGFTADEESLNNCALGYKILTEGVCFDLNPDLLTKLPLSTSTQKNLCYHAIHHAFVTVLTVEHQENYFAAEYLVNVLLTMADRWCGGEGGTPGGLRDWFTRGNKQFDRWLTEAITGIQQLSRKNQQAVYQLIESSNDYLSIFVNLYAEIHSCGLRYQQYLRDSFQYSLTQALKSLAQEVAGVEALNYVAAWTELHADFEGMAADRIWLYEIGMGGIGVMRATHDLLRNHPDKFWTTLANKMTRCTTAQEEAFLRHLLAQPESWLEECATRVSEITTAGKSSDRQNKIEELMAQVRQQLGVPMRQTQLKAIFRVFIPDYNQQLGDTPLVNWRIFREINHEFLPDCAEQLGRDPTFTEASALVYRKLVKARRDNQAPPYPELTRLLEIYETEYGDSANEARKAFEAGVERRMLLNCRCNCSSCLDDRSGDIESPGLSRHLLNRPLLTEWLNQVRTPQTLELDDTVSGASICDKMRSLLENGCQTIYLRVKTDNLASLCATISYLTDAGIDTDIGMVYPMITDIQTIYSNDLRPSQASVIQVTVRTIK